MALFPALNGSIFNDPNFESAKIYWIDLGAKRWIVNEDTYQGVFGEFGKANKRQEDLSQFDLGPNVESGAKLVRVGNHAEIYLISQNTARWIPTEGIRSKYNLWGNVHSVSATTFASYVTGPAFE